MSVDLKNVKVWPHLAIVAVVCAVVSGIAVGWWLKHEQTTSAMALPNAARIQRVDGEVALNNSTSAETTDENWIEARPNQPFTVGDKIYTRENSRASLAFTGRNFARLDPNTSLDVLSLSDRRTQLALRDGSAIFDVGYLAPGEMFEVATPYGAVDLQQPGLYNVGIDDGNVLVSVLSGLAQVVGLGGSGQISKGEVLRLIGQTASDVVLSRIDGRDAGYLVDDYYGYQYPQYYDGRYSDYNAYLNDPNYFDPYRRTSSYQYVNSYIPGLSDLDDYGNWQNLNGYGNAWSPRVDNGWSPYQDGYWMNDHPYGPTWVSAEPWGYAPYHYGRWANVGDRWYWIPDNVNTAPVYSPAMVAFIPFNQNEVGWVPLGPGDAYSPHYYNNEWEPYYYDRTRNYPGQLANLYVRDAVPVVYLDDFDDSMNWRRARKANREMLGGVNPVLDPLLYTPLSNAVIHSAWGRGKKDLPPGIAKKLHDTTVYTSAAPVAPPFRKDIQRSMRVEAVNDRSKGNKFKVKDERGDRGDKGNKGDKHFRPEAQAPDQIRLSDRNENRKQERRIESGARQAQAPQRATIQAEGAKGERVGHKAEVARPEKQKGNAGARVYLPAAQPQQRSVNADRGRSAEVKAEKKQSQGNQAKPQGPAAAKPGKGKGKGH